MILKVLQKLIKVLILLYYRLNPSLISLHLGTREEDHDFTIVVNRYPMKKGDKGYHEIGRITNGDRFRSMKDEELSGWINCCGVCSKAEESCDGECRKGIIEFLGQEYKGGF